MDAEMAFKAKEETTRRRVFLFLQGPNCTFFQEIADRLEELGHQCLRINLCFGDWLFWRRNGAINYRGSFRKWDEYLDRLLDREGVTDMLMLGEQRAYHKVATRLARERGIRIIVTDFGYLRPDWITLEENGMSGDSLFPRDPEVIRKMAKELEPVNFTTRFEDGFTTMAFAEVISACGSWLFRFMYPGYRKHHLDNPILFYCGVGLRLLRAKRLKKRAEEVIERLIVDADVAPFFLFPMQMEMDFQIRAYSPYPDQTTPISEVIASFAKHANNKARLAFKIHPMDPGLVNWKRRIAKIALQEGVAERVFFMDGGSLELLLERCSGVITINSTVGVTALQFGKPLKVLGDAVYDIPGLTFRGNLDAFWKSLHAPDAGLRDDCLKVLARTIQLRGVYFRKDGRKNAVDEAVARLHEGTLNIPDSSCRRQAC
jgi:capsular polysaccharide export protein